MARRFYHLLLYVYPRPMRAQFGRDMELAFAALCRERRGDLRGLLAVFARETTDALRAAWRQRSGSGAVGGAPIPPPRRGTDFARRLAADLWLALRVLRRTAAFTAVAATTLALGIGATTGMFALLDATMLRPLPGVSDPAGLVTVYEFTRGRHGAASYPDYRDLGEVEAFAGLTAVSTQPAVLDHGGEVERLSAQLVSAGYFGVLGVHPAVGRSFSAAGEDGGAATTVVLSHALWTRRFGADTGVIGTTVRLDGAPFRIIGVAPAGFRGTGLQGAPDLWLPIEQIDTFLDLPLAGSVLDFRGLMAFSMVARLRPGVDLAAAQAAVDLRAAAIEEAAPGMFDRPRAFLLVPAQRSAFAPTARGEVGRYTALLLGVSAGLLVIACINIAGLLAVRAAARRREIAVRRALGAGRGRLVQQLVSEGLLLAAAGGIGGVLVALAALPLLESLRLPAAVDPDLALDGHLLLFNIAVAGAAGVLFSVAPAWQAAGRRAAGVLQGATMPARSRRFDVRAVLVVTQVAVAVVLLVGAALLARTVLNLSSVERGFDAEGLLAASFNLDQAGYDEVGGAELLRAISARLADLDGVRSVAVGSDIPLGGVAGAGPLFVDGVALPPGTAAQSLVGPRYFATLGVPLAAGRELDERDRAGAPGVVLVNEAFARSAWPGREAVGKQVSGGPEGPAFTVVGVVRDYHHADLREPPRPHLYWAIEQQYRFGKDAGTRRLLVRVTGPPEPAVAAMRAVVRDLEPRLPLFDVATMSDHVAATFREERQSAVVVGSFSLLALLLSAVGLFGVLAYTVGQRRREIGIRCALGAHAGQVAAMVVRSGVLLAAVGVAFGLLAAAAASRVLSSLLFDVTPVDAGTFAGIALVVFAVAAAASFGPARRAVRVDPAVALRGD
ncbi:MAG: ADOP family duplicated permease [Acidobacteriota bacterium]